MLYANNAQVTSWYLKYRVDVYKYINSLVLEPTLAEDLMQETFVKAFLYSSTFEGRSSVKTWLYSIAYNLTMDFYKKKQSFQKFKNNYIKDQNWNKVLLDITNWEEYTELIDTLNNLKDSYKQVIILRKLQGYSVKETGEILNWSENKVKVTLSRAIRSLRNQLI